MRGRGDSVLDALSIVRRQVPHVIDYFKDVESFKLLRVLFIGLVLLLINLNFPANAEFRGIQP